MASRSGSAHVARGARLGKNVRLGEGVVVAAGASLGDGVRVGSYAVIRENVHVDAGSHIGEHAILGERSADYYDEPDGYTNAPLQLGRGSVVRSGTVLYAGSSYGDWFQTGHHAVIREGNRFGRACLVGSMTQVENGNRVGDGTRILSLVEIGKRATIGKFVWVFPFAILTDDRHPPLGRKVEASTIEDFAIIGPHAVLMPGTHIGRNAIVGGGAVVTKDAPAGKVVLGVPAKVAKDVKEIEGEPGLRVYPWFDRVPAEKKARYRWDRL